MHRIFPPVAVCSRHRKKRFGKTPKAVCRRPLIASCQTLPSRTSNGLVARRKRILETWIRLERFRKARGFVFGHCQIVKEIIAAILRRRSRNLPFPIAQTLERRNHKRTNLLRRRTPFDNEIISRQTTHRTPIDDSILPNGIVSQKSGHDMLDRVQCVGMNRRFGVRTLHADVERRCKIPSDRIYAGNVDTGLNPGVVNLKAGNKFHARNHSKTVAKENHAIGFLSRLNKTSDSIDGANGLPYDGFCGKIKTVSVFHDPCTHKEISRVSMSTAMRLKSILFFCSFILCAKGQIPEIVDTVAPIPAPVVRIGDPRENEKPVQVEMSERTLEENALFVRVSASFVFTNPNGRSIAGEFEFPIPEDAVVCGYRLEVNGEMTPAAVCDKETARVAFENETRKRVDPGLVEHVKGNVWKTRIFPLDPGKPRRAEVDYIAPKKNAGKDAVGTVYERDGNEVYRARIGEAFIEKKVFAEGIILWDASLSREGKVADDRRRLEERLPDTGLWKLIAYSNVPDAPRMFTRKTDLLKAIDAVVYDGAADLDAALALCIGEERLVFTDELDTSSHLVEVEKLAPAEADAMRDKAKPAKILATVWTARNAKDLPSCRKYGVAGPGMSLLVLETLEQYLEHKIEPSPELSIHAEWVKRRAAEDDPIDAKKSQVEHEAQLLSIWQERVKWWKNPKPSPKTPKSGLFETVASGAMPRSEAANADFREAAIEPEMVEDAAPSETLEPDNAESPAIQTEMVLKAAPSATLDPDNAEPPAIETEMVQEAEPSENLDPDNAEPPATRSSSPMVALKAWDPKTPYLEVIEKAAADGGNDAAYAAYLSERKTYRDSPAFYLDVAGWFFRSGNAARALRILSNLAEFKLESAPLWRTMGWRLREEACRTGDLNLCNAAVRTFRHVKEMRGEEGQSWRDLATVLTERGKRKSAAGDRSGAGADLSEAAALLKTAAFADPLRRASLRADDLQICVFALEDLNGLLAWCETNKNRIDGFVAPELDEAYRRNLPVKLRIVMTWDADETDIDLHVLEPNGEECYFGNSRTAEGGFLSGDVTTGYGPEEYLKKDLEKGVYKILSNYFASHQTALTGPTTVQATVYTDWATATEKMQVLTLRLEKPKDKQLVGEVTLTE